MKNDKASAEIQLLLRLKSDSLQQIRRQQQHQLPWVLSKAFLSLSLSPKTYWTYTVHTYTYKNTPGEVYAIDKSKEEGRVR